MASSTNPTVLRIDEFTMRPIRASDLDALAAIWADPEVTRFLPSRGVPISREGTENALVSFLEHWQKRGYGIWAIVKNTLLEMVGYCGLRYLDELGGVEVLYGLTKAYWGRGIATQATKASISYSFNVANLDRVIALLLPDNQASRRVIEKADLHYEKQVHIFNLDALYYSIVQDQDTITASPVSVAMVSEEVEYRDEVELPRDQVINLYSQCGWSSADKPDALLLALSNSQTVVSAWHQKSLIGLGNAISDKALVVYYSHLLVLPSYQNMGVGREIMKRLQSHYIDFHQQILLAIDSAAPFYEKLGFKYSHGVRAMWIYNGGDIDAAQEH